MKRWQEFCLPTKWAEIRRDYIDEDENKIYIDAWETDDDNEQGVVIAKINIDTKEVEYIDDSAKFDGYAQAMIILAINELSE